VKTVKTTSEKGEETHRRCRANTLICDIGIHLDREVFGLLFQYLLLLVINRDQWMHILSRILLTSYILLTKILVKRKHFLSYVRAC
jgi:hypothetical protein